MSEVIVLYEGYSKMDGDTEMLANCSCTVIKGSQNVIVDTMTPWDSNKILNALTNQNLKPNDINYVISTHGHSDHTGNNNLFLKAKHIVGFSISFQERYFIHPFDEGKEYIINENIKVIPTPGHTLSDVSVIVKTTQNETIAIAGDLFERFEDIENPEIWQGAGSEHPQKQKINRSKLTDIADWIIPGHGPKFQVTEEIRNSLKNQLLTEGI